MNQLLHPGLPTHSKREGSLHKIVGLPSVTSKKQVNVSDRNHCTNLLNIAGHLSLQILKTFQTFSIFYQKPRLKKYGKNDYWNGFSQVKL